MADGFSVAGVPFAADDTSQGQIPWSKISHSDDGIVRPVTDGDPFPVKVQDLKGSSSASGGLTTVAVGSSGTLIATAGARKGIEIQNLSPVTFYLRFGATASATLYHRRLRPGRTWFDKMPFCWQGSVSAWHGNAAAQQLVVVEFS